MKSIALKGLVVGLGLALLANCGTSTTKPSIVGNWFAVRTANADGSNASDLQERSSRVYTFTSDAKVCLVVLSTAGTESCGTYEQKDGSLVIKMPNPETTTITLSADQLVIITTASNVQHQYRRISDQEKATIRSRQ